MTTSNCREWRVLRDCVVVLVDTVGVYRVGVFLQQEREHRPELPIVLDSSTEIGVAGAFHLGPASCDLMLMDLMLMSMI